MVTIYRISIRLTNKKKRSSILSSFEERAQIIIKLTGSFEERAQTTIKLTGQFCFHKLRSSLAGSFVSTN